MTALNGQLCVLFGKIVPVSYTHLCDGFGIVHGQGDARTQGQHRKAHDHTVVIVPMQNTRRSVQPVRAAVPRNGAALAFQHAAAGTQLGLHGSDAVTLLQA